MDSRLWGIAIPAVIVIVLVVFSSMNIGYFEDRVSFEHVDRAVLTTNSYGDGDNIPVMKISVENDYFMPRKYISPKFVACLKDNEMKQRMQDLEVSYFLANGASADVRPTYKLDYDDLKGGLNMESHSKKEITIMVQPVYVSISDKTPLDMNKFDELLLIERDEGYKACSRLTEKDVDGAIRIPLI